jgi:hypothetical protein
MLPPEGQRLPSALPSPSTQTGRSGQAERGESLLTDNATTHSPLPFLDTWLDTGLNDYSSAAPLSLGTTTPPPIAHGPHRGPGEVNPQLVISAERKRVLLGQPGTPSTDIVVRHTVQFVMRILRVWPRMLASYSTTERLPPIIHKLQLADGMPAPLANCCTLVRMWADHSEEGSRTLVRNTILEEVRRLLREVSIYLLKVYDPRPLST